MLQVKPHVVPLHVEVASATETQGAHEFPQVSIEVFHRHVPAQSCIPPGHVQVPRREQTPPVGVVQPPEVRATDEHITRPAVQTSVPSCAQPPVPEDVQGAPGVVQLVPHADIPAGQSVTQPPVAQTCPVEHAFPHDPQLLASIEVSIQAPTHSVVPFGQDPPHDPETQVALPPTGTAQGTHDAAQEPGDVFETQLPPQSCVPIGHLHSPEASHSPLVGALHPPEVRGKAEHAASPPLQTSIPVRAQPPLPFEVHGPPSSAHRPPQRLVPTGQTVPQIPKEQL